MNKNSTMTTGYLLVIIAGVCWGTMSIFVNDLNGLGLNSFHIMAIRAYLSVAFLFVLLLIKDRKLLRIAIKDIWIFIGSGILSLTFFSYCYFNTITKSGAAIAVVLLYTSPVFVMLFSAVAFKEKITKRKIIAIVLTTFGCVMVAGLLGSGNRIGVFDFLVGLGAGFGYALYSIFAGFAVKKYSALTITFYTLVFSGLAIPFLTDVPGLMTVLADNITMHWIYILGVSLVCTVIPYVCYTVGLDRMDKGKAAVLVTVEPVVGALLGIFVFKEAVDAFKIIGILLIFAAVITLSTNENQVNN